MHSRTLPAPARGIQTPHKKYGAVAWGILWSAVVRFWRENICGDMSHHPESCRCWVCREIPFQ